jgi:hypothetical protein
MGVDCAEPPTICMLVGDPEFVSAKVTGAEEPAVVAMME